MQVATEQSTLPVLRIEVRGEVVSSNADVFRHMVSEWVAGFNRDLADDSDFAQAEDDVKRLSEAEKAVTEAKERALGEAEELYALLQTLDDTSEEIRQARLDLSRQIKAKKEEIKAAVVNDAVSGIGAHGSHFRREIEDAIKGKRTIATMQEAVRSVVDRAESLIRQNTETIAAFLADHPTLVPDASRLEVMPPETLAVELERRRERAEAEAEKARMRAEAEAEQARLRAEAEDARKSAETAREPEPEPREAAPEAPRPAVSAKPSAPDAGEELQWFRQQVMGALAQLKEPREALSDPGNRAKAKAFSEAVGAAFAKHLS